MTMWQKQGDKITGEVTVMTIWQIDPLSHWKDNNNYDQLVQWLLKKMTDLSHWNDHRLAEWASAKKKI